MRDDQLVAIVSLFLALVLAVGKYRGIQAELRQRDLQNRDPGQPPASPRLPDDRNV